MADRSNRVTAHSFGGGFGRSLFAAGLLSAAVAFAAGPVFAQDAPKPQAPAATKPAQKPAAPAAKPKPGADAKAAAQPVPEDQYPWVKICQKDNEGKTVCLIAKELHSAEGQLIASVALRDTEGEPKKTLLIAVPPGVLVLPGMRVMIDKGKPEEVKYRICFPNACYADLEMSDQMVADIKKGALLVVTSLSVQQKPIGYPFRLDTFKTAFDGPAIDPAGAQQGQDQLQSELQKRAEEAAKKLQSGAAPAAPAPAAPKP